MERITRRLFWLIPLALILFAVVLGSYFVSFHGPVAESTSTWGEFGDFVGGVLNPLLSFLALIALLWTIVLQARELKASTHELANSAKALDQQNATLRIQNFESSFFQMLRLHNEIVNAMDIVDGSNRITKGRDCLSVYSNRLRQKLTEEQAHDSLERMTVTYQAFYSKHQHDLGHYFRLLYHIVKFIKFSDIQDKKFYTNLVRAQLSSAELTLLFFNCLTTLGNEKFKPLVEEFSLLKTLPKGEYPSLALRKLYEPGAYAGSKK